jgi:hypothetical protein
MFTKFLLILISMYLTGCYSAVFVSQTESKQQAFKSFEGFEIEGVTAKEFLKARTFNLVSGKKFDGIRFYKSFDPENYISGFYEKINTSCAAALSHDGYFLVAKHSTESENLTLIIKGKKEQYHKRVRVVWKSEAHDVAIIHVEANLKNIFYITDTVEEEEKIILLGQSGPSAGEVNAVSVFDEKGQSIKKIIHNAPMDYGDSGGPTINLRGELLAINTDVYALPKFWCAVSYGLSKNTIYTIIANDRRLQPLASNKEEGKHPG